MSLSQKKRAKKGDLIRRFAEKISQFKQILVVTLSNVGSNQVQTIRNQLNKKKCELIIGKNTVIRKALQILINPKEKAMEGFEEFQSGLSANPQLSALNDLCKQKVGFIFTNVPAFELKPLVEGNKVQTAARVHIPAPIDVVIPAGPTGLDPSQIGFFHALHITTKIQKAQIEIVKDYKVCTKGEAVTNSQATLLQKLGLKPFEYGMNIIAVYEDGSILTPEVLSITPSEICQKFSSFVSNISAMSLELGIPTQCAIPHMLNNAFKNIAAFGIESGYPLDILEKLSKKQDAPAEAPAKMKEEPKKRRKTSRRRTRRRCRHGRSIRLTKIV